jgi:hypothetical protein
MTVFGPSKQQAGDRAEDLVHFTERSSVARCSSGGECRRQD